MNTNVLIILAALLSSIVFGCASPSDGVDDAIFESSDSIKTNKRDDFMGNCVPGAILEEELSDCDCDGETAGQARSVLKCDDDGMDATWVDVSTCEDCGSTVQACDPGTIHQEETGNCACGGEFKRQRKCGDNGFPEAWQTVAECAQCACNIGDKFATRQGKACGSGCSKGFVTEQEVCVNGVAGPELVWQEQPGCTADSSRLACQQGDAQERSVAGVCGNYTQTRGCSDSCDWDSWSGNDPGKACEHGRSTYCAGETTVFECHADGDSDGDKDDLIYTCQTNGSWKKADVVRRGCTVSQDPGKGTKVCDGALFKRNKWGYQIPGSTVPAYIGDARTYWECRNGTLVLTDRDYCTMDQGTPTVSDDYAFAPGTTACASQPGHTNRGRKFRCDFPEGGTPKKTMLNNDFCQCKRNSTGTWHWAGDKVCSSGQRWICSSSSGQFVPYPSENHLC